ncbi:hypothetical protein, partial [Fluviicola sp.]|uniref:hypothetical protein n=1 Tax=Fluviicola sp. TaxID=1917219 RepID=UPI0026063750
AASITTSKGKVVELKQLIILHEWAYQFSQVIDWNFVNADAKNKDEFGQLLNSINELEKADKYLYGKIYIENIPEYLDKEFSLNQWIKDRSDTLYAAENSYDEFKTKLGVSNQVLTGLKKRKGEADKSLNDVIDILSTRFDEKFTKFIVASRKDDFQKYSNSTSVWLSMNHIDRFDANQKAIEKFESYLKKLKEHVDKFTKKECDKNNVCFQYYEDSDIKLDWKFQKMKSFSYEYQKLESNGSEVAQSSIKNDFTVGKKLGLYPFVSTGVFYTGFSYPNYTISTDNGINTVGEATDSKVYVRPALFLNFLVTGKLNPVYPFLQIGVSTGKNDAIFPVGGGITLGKSFSISGGAMVGYRKDLKTLNVGDVVKDETALENNLIYKGFVSWYFSINYNIGKK